MVGLRRPTLPVLALALALPGCPARILASLRATDLVARFGGDEFMVLIHGGPSHEQQRRDVDEVARKLLAAIEVPVAAEGRPISVTPSIGVSFFPGDATSPDELVLRPIAVLVSVCVKRARKSLALS